MFLLLPEDEQEKQNEWFWSIMKYINTFKEEVQHWLSELEGLMEDVMAVQSCAGAVQEELPNPQVLVHASSINNLICMKKLQFKWPS